MNNLFPFPPLGERSTKTAARFIEDMEIAAVVHELKNQACIINLGLATLRFPRSSDEERQRHLAALQTVVGEMSLLFQRLDDGLAKARRKRRSLLRAGPLPGGAAPKRTVRPLKAADPRYLSLRDGASARVSQFEDEPR